MPHIQYNKDGTGKIIFDGDDFSVGLIPNYTASLITNQLGRGLAGSKAMNPFRYYPYVAPGYDRTDVSNVSEVSEFCRKGLVNGTNAFIVTNGAKLQKLDISGNGSLTAGFHTISGSGVVGDDASIYNAKISGTNASRFFYSYNYTNNWDVGTFDFNATFDDDFMSTVPAMTTSGTIATTATTTATGTGTKFLSTLNIGDTIVVSGETIRTIATISSDTVLTVTVAFSNTASGLTYKYFPASGSGFPHPLNVGDDDLLYIGDRNFLHAYDGQTGSNGTFYPRVLTLPFNYIITSLAKTLTGLMITTYRANSVVIGGSTTLYKGDARMWEWNYNELDIVRSYSLNDNYATESFQYNGIIGVFSSGTPSDPGQAKISRLQMLIGGVFKPVVNFIGEIPIRGGVDIIGDSIQWNSQGTVFCFGSPILGAKSGLNKLTEGSGQTSGMLSTLTSALQFMSSGATTSGGLQNMSLNYIGTSAQLATGLAAPIFETYHKGRIENVKVRFATTCTPGRGVDIQLRDRWVGVSQLPNITTITNSTNIVQDFTQDVSGNPFIDFDALKLIAAYSSGTDNTDAPIIASVEVEFSSININDATV